MQIADIAWTKLTPRARQNITAILQAGDPRFQPTGTDENSVREAFRKAATFPDVIKGNRDTRYEPIIADMNARFFTTAPPDPNNNEDKLCKTWHYYDTPIRDHGDAGKRPPGESNALKALALAREQLALLQRSRQPDRKMQCWWLYWTEHLVGDLHQPLHCVSSYEFLPNGDAGGNLFLIANTTGGNGSSRLHGFWDGGISRAIAREREQGQSPSVQDVSTRWTGDAGLAPSASEARNLNVAAWIKTGAMLADTIVYQGIERNAAPSDAYIATEIALSKKQAVLAGTRLAAILNTTLGR
jgi:hypothetical protein